MPIRPTTRTLGDVKRAVRRTFGDEASVQINDQDLVAWANEAQMQIVEKNNNIKKVSEVEIHPKNYFSHLPDENINQITMVLFDGNQLRSVDVDKAMEMYLTADTVNGLGTPEVWGLVPDVGLVFSPPARDSGKIQILYTAYPTELNQDSQLLAVPNKYFQAVVDYCLWHAFELDEDWAAASVKENHYRVSVEEQAEEEREAQDLVYPTIKEVSW